MLCLLVSIKDKNKWIMNIKSNNIGKKQKKEHRHCGDSYHTFKFVVLWILCRFYFHQFPLKTSNLIRSSKNLF